MKLSEMFPTNLLKAQDVSDAGGEMPLTIKDVQMQDFDKDDGSKERKPVIYFTTDKQMVCNKTNATTIAEILGNDTDLWIGKEITLIVQTVQFGKDQVPAIRIKNLNSKDVLIQSYWTKTRELGFTRQDGLDHLKEFGGDFAAALKGLQAPE